MNKDVLKSINFKIKTKMADMIYNNSDYGKIIIGKVDFDDTMLYSKLRDNITKYAKGFGVKCSGCVSKHDTSFGTQIELFMDKKDNV